MYNRKRMDRITVLKITDVFYSLFALMWYTDVEYSDKKADLMTDEWHEDRLSLAYENFILQHDRLNESEQNNYRSSLPMNEQLKWAE